MGIHLRNNKNILDFKNSSLVPTHGGRRRKIKIRKRKMSKKNKIHKKTRKRKMRKKNKIHKKKKKTKKRKHLQIGGNDTKAIERVKEYFQIDLFLLTRGIDLLRFLETWSSTQQNPPTDNKLDIRYILYLILKFMIEIWRPPIGTRSALPDLYTFGEKDDGLPFLPSEIGISDNKWKVLDTRNRMLQYKRDNEKKNAILYDLGRILEDQARSIITILDSYTHSTTTTTWVRQKNIILEKMCVDRNWGMFIYLIIEFQKGVNTLQKTFKMQEKEGRNTQLIPRNEWCKAKDRQEAAAQNAAERKGQQRTAKDCHISLGTEKIMFMQWLMGRELFFKDFENDKKKHFYLVQFINGILNDAMNTEVSIDPIEMYNHCRRNGVCKSTCSGGKNSGREERGSEESGDEFKFGSKKGGG